MKKLYILLIALSMGISAVAQDTPSEDELAKASQNPLAAMIRFPFQNNTTYGIGEHNEAQNVLNIQPIYPLKFEKFNIINFNAQVYYSAVTPTGWGQW
ncbi:hypothetical protein [Carboxylicivirga sp. N1Y90]|uniref:hypothetical protein n=1 Tax=Carboxylicivirga fragile TaxID=3417571 RepID=UPI003D32BE18|nr:hypothetical protein [Marinilabiliaceae bacterium N1Y90]